MTDLPLAAVTGASGLLGRPLMEKLISNPGYEARGIARRRTGGAVDRVDLTDIDAVISWLDEKRPRILVHLAAERRPDAYAEDPEAADRLNINATADLAGACSDRKIPILFMSTSYVFDGTSPPYSPGDQPNPLNAYGRSKRAGEEAVIDASPANRVLRVPMLHGLSADLEESSVTQVAKMLLEAGGPVSLDIRQRRYPAWTPDVADAVVGVIPHILDGSVGGPCLHFCPPAGQSYTKLDMGRIMAPLLGLDPAVAVADERPPTGAPRPEDVGMACPDIEALGLLKNTPFPEAIAATLDSIRKAGGLD